MTKPPALVFDLDGTLIDSIPQVAAAVNATLAEAARGPLALAQVRDMIGAGARVPGGRALPPPRARAPARPAPRTDDPRHRPN